MKKIFSVLALCFVLMSFSSSNVTHNVSSNGDPFQCVLLADINVALYQGVTSYTESVQLQQKTLTVRLTSSVLREELSYGKDKMVRMINEEMGEDLVSKLMLV